MRNTPSNTPKTDAAYEGGGWKLNILDLCREFETVLRAAAWNGKYEDGELACGICGTRALDCDDIDGSDGSDVCVGRGIRAALSVGQQAPEA